jgi:hypothetical protein
VALILVCGGLVGRKAIEEKVLLADRSVWWADSMPGLARTIPLSGSAMEWAFSGNLEHPELASAHLHAKDGVSTRARNFPAMPYQQALSATDLVPKRVGAAQAYCARQPFINRSAAR